MTIDQAQHHMYKAQSALSKLDTLLAMMKITSEYLGENPLKAPMIEWMNVTELLQDQMEDISPNLENIEVFLNGLFCASKGVSLCQS